MCGRWAKRQCWSDEQAGRDDCVMLKREMRKEVTDDATAAMFRRMTPVERVRRGLETIALVKQFIGAHEIETSGLG
jgi:hypothetical protein